ncbi:50S ribosomal protein L3 [Planctomycetes bacterium Pan216]|uniref:Large ribosomal subunit protein uL3 n=1 Tax=Kolteria novifilia TaxID=2527975 RepID=A0A518AZM0_9BACT|nr:50S ribosomal protein L3 [Planctomycetes bacterium Pan216]
MTPTLLGQKIGMTQVFDDEGNVHPVTVLKLGPCQVLQVRTAEKDKYEAVQLGYLDKPRKSATKAERGHVAKVGAEPKRFVREVRLDAPAEHEAGAVLTADIFDGVKAVDIIGTMKGRGYSGTMKRHGFGGLEATHGVQRSHRAPGSIGCSAYPARVIKGRKMNGQYGNTRSTVRNVKVVRLDAEQSLLLVRGGVPGPNGGMVMVRETNRKKSKKA